MSNERASSLFLEQDIIISAAVFMSPVNFVLIYNGQCRLSSTYMELVSNTRPNPVNRIMERALFDFLPSNIVIDNPKAQEDP